VFCRHGFLKKKNSHNFKRHKTPPEKTKFKAFSYYRTIILILILILILIIIIVIIIIIIIIKGTCKQVLHITYLVCRT